jgi:hypothetical protein
MHPSSIFDLVLRDHDRRLAECSAARERARFLAARGADRTDARARPPDPTVIHTALLLSAVWAAAR